MWITNGSDEVFSLINDFWDTYATEELQESQMSSEALRKTRSYFQHASRKEEVRFASSGDVERSFSLAVIDDSCIDERCELKRGIAIIDNDNLRIVLDGLDADKVNTAILVMLRIADFQTMEWQEFSEYCRKNPLYRGGIPDIDHWTKAPHPGNPQNQTFSGLAFDLHNDIRSDLLRDLDEDPEVPYSFPAIDRQGIEAEICSHLLFTERNGRRSHIAWDIRMNMSWNRTGRIRGGTYIDPITDHDWNQLLEDDPEIIKLACKKAIAEYTSGRTAILDMEEYPCEFRRIGNNMGFLIIDNFAGHFLFATPDISIPERLARLTDREIGALWAVVRVMDFETSRQMRITEMEYQMHLLRVDVERNNWKVPA